MKESKIHEFNPVIYPRRLFVSITDNEESLIDKIETDCDLSGFAERAEAIVFPCTLKETGNLGVMAVFQNKRFMSIKNIAHESVHIASIIFSDCGMTMGFEEGKDEHFAYLVGWAAECINKVKLNNT